MSAVSEAAKSAADLAASLGALDQAQVTKQQAADAETAQAADATAKANDLAAKLLAAGVKTS